MSKQAIGIDDAEKYQNERDKIEKLHNQVEQIKFDFKEKEFDIECKYRSKIKGLEKENSHLHKVIDKFYETIYKFIRWICKKFDMGVEDNLIRDFEKETKTYLDAEELNEKKEKKI